MFILFYFILILLLVQFSQYSTLYVSGYLYFFFFFKQKTAYEMRISDWSSDVCSSDLAPVTELVEGAGHHEVHGLGSQRRALQRRAEVDVAHLDDAERRVDAQVAGDAQCLPGGLAPRSADDGVEEGVGAAAGLLHPVAQGIEAGEGTVGQVGPVAALLVGAVGGEEVLGVARRVERLDAAEAPLHRRARRRLARLPVEHGFAYRLAELVQQGGRSEERRVGNECVSTFRNRW